MGGGKDGQILFHRILPTIAGSLKSTTAEEWHLKVEHIEYDVSLTKNYCIKVCQNAKNQLNSFPHSAYFNNLDHTHSKNIELTFSFP